MTTRAERGYASWRRGGWAETLCRLLLRLKGWRILATNCRTPMGEIDIIARRGEVLAVIEVKARPTLDAAYAAIHPRQQARLTRAAAVWLSGRSDLSRFTLRFDAILVAPRTWPRHVEDAWRVG